MKRLKTFLLKKVNFVLWCSLFWLIPVALQAEVVDQVVAVINGDPVTLYELDLAMRQDLSQIMDAPSGASQENKFKDSKNAALQRLVEDKLLEQEMKKNNIVVSEADEQKAIENILARNKMTLPQLKKEIQGKGQAWEDYLAGVKRQLKQIKFMGRVLAPKVKVTDADLEEFFAQNPEQFAAFQTVEMAQVIIPVKPSADDVTLSAAQKKAAEAATKARRGGDFEELGKKYSEMPQAALKATYPVAQLAPQIISILSDLKVGQVSEPVRSSMGLHVIKLYERSTMAGEQYQAIREQLREKVFELKLQEEMGEYLDKLKGRSLIELKA